MARHTPQGRAAISRGLRRYHERRRKVARVAPSDMLKLRETGSVPKRLAPFLDAATLEAEALFESLGGRENMSAQRVALVEDTARLGLVMRASLARFVQAADGDAASRVGTLAAARRANLVALGLDRVRRELDLGTYLEQRASANGAGRANGSDPTPHTDHEADGAARAEGARVVHDGESRETA